MLLRPGDVVDHQCGKLLVIAVSESGATCVHNGIRHVSYETTGGRHVEFSTVNRARTYISENIEPDWVIETGVDVSPYIKKSHTDSTEKTKTQTTESKKTMKDTIKAPKLATVPKPIANPRGGLAADAKEDAAKPEAKKEKQEEKHEPRWPRNPYDLFMWQCLENGGTQEEIVAKIVAKFKNDPARVRAKPETAIKWIPTAMKEMKEEGLTPNLETEKPVAKKKKTQKLPTGSSAQEAPATDKQ